VVHGFPPFQVGGTEVLARNVARCLSKSGHQVVVFAPTSLQEQAGDVFLDSVVLHRVFFSRGYEAPFSDSYLDDAVDFRFANFVSELRPDVALVWHTVGMSAGMFEVLSSLNIPSILFLADFYYACHMTHLLTANMKPCDGPGDGTRCADCILATAHGLRETETANAAELGRRRVSRLRELLEKVSLMVAPSQFVKEKYVEFGLDRRRILVIPPGVDVNAIKRLHKPIHSDKVRFGYFGGNVEAKGVSIVLDAFNQIADDTVELVIAGLGTEPSIFPLPIPRHARLVGTYSPDTLGEMLSRIDVLIVPSRCHESYNLVAREAFAAKIPVIASDLRAQSDAIREGINGFCFKSGDTADLISKMQLLKDRRIDLEALKHRIHNGPEIDRQAAKIERALQGLVARQGNTSSHRRKSTRPSRRSSDGWYIEKLAEKAIANLEQQVARLKNDLSAREEEAARLKNDLSAREEEAARLKNDLSAKEKETTRLKNEIHEIKRTVGYRFARFYGSRVDQVFPDGTKRGELRRKAIERLRGTMQDT